MKIKERKHEYIRKNGTTDTRIVELDYPFDNSGNIVKKIFKFSYRAGNAFEYFTGELFDGTKLNPIFEMKDLGVAPDSSSYCIPTEIQLQARIEMLNCKGKKFIENLF